AGGRSFGTFRRDLEAAVRRAYVASTASVAIGKIRQVSVLVAGEVNVPGQRIATGLSSVVDVLLLSGGVKKTGSLRNVRVVRGRFRLSVQRIETDGRLALVPLTNESSIVRDSEILRVELGADLAASQATLSGGTGLAGQYAITTGTKLSDMIRAPGALGPSP